DAFLLVFILFMGLFFAAAAAPSSTRDGSLPFLFLLPFIFFGFFLVGPRILSVIRESSDARSAVPDRRVLIRPRSRLVHIDLATLPYLAMERSWLTGPTIFFGPRQKYEGCGGF